MTLMCIVSENLPCFYSKVMLAVIHYISMVGWLPLCYLSGLNSIYCFDIQMSGLLQASSAQNWLSSQGSSSGLIVKRTIRVDVPVDNFPNV